jgi:hypothetical protein
MKWTTPAWLGLAALVFASCGSTGYRTPSDDQFTDYLSRDDNQRRYQDLVDYLEQEGVGDVVAARHLLRQGTDWESVDLPPFAIPPDTLWPKVVNTLEVLRDDVIPAVGPIEVVSGFRTRAYNEVAGGATRSKHLEFSAVDVIPLEEIDRDELVSRLKAIWNDQGPAKEIGLGLYDGVRFHIDTGGFRTW